MNNPEHPLYKTIITTQQCLQKDPSSALLQQRLLQEIFLAHSHHDLQKVLKNELA